MDKDYVIGIDFGSDSVRAVVIDIKDGSTVGSDFCEYRRWMQKLYCDASKNMFRQHPLDYLESFEACVKGALKNAGENAGKYVRGIGVDATGSTPCPVDRNHISAPYESSDVDPRESGIYYSERGSQCASDPAVFTVGAGH